MDAFTELGSRVARSWRKYRYDTRALPEVAAIELSREPLDRVVDYRSILNWIGSTETLPYQMNVDATFGEPPVTLFWHTDFYIEALFWASSTTTIHGHGFVGAFQVLTGTSLQSLFEFDADDPRFGRCRLGRLRQTRATLLRTGVTQMIEGGERFIHSVFHLGYPSVTIVVRSHNRVVEPQYNYYRPGVALAYRYESTFDHLTSRLLQVARLQALLMSDDLHMTVEKIGARRDLAAVYRLLELVQPILWSHGRLETSALVIGTLASTFGLTQTSRLAEALTLEAQLSSLVRARQTVVEDDLRLFLALLLTLQGRQFIMSAVTDYTGIPEPSRAIAGWICKLGARGILNVPTDIDTENLLTVWLTFGHDVASKDTNGDEVAGKMQRLKAEPLLASLLCHNGPS